MNHELQTLIQAAGQQPEHAELLQLLKSAQALCGTLTPEIQKELAEALDIKPGVIAALIRVTPALKAMPYRHLITVCIGNHCRAKGSFALLKCIQQELGIETGQTTRDGRIRLATRTCLKNCKNAPNVQINDKRYTGLTPDDIPMLLQSLK